MPSAAALFRSLHQPGLPLLVPNPWDIGSAVILERLGFKALATTSSGMAFGLGLADGAVPPEAALDHCRSLVAATSIPISGDLERGFGRSPEAVAETVSRAAATGLAGCSIEDHTGRPDDPIFPRTLAIERIEAAVEACGKLDDGFVLTARCENLLWTDGPLHDVIEMLAAYEAAGADVVFAPGLATIDDIALVCDAVDVPVSVGLEMAAAPSVAELADAGVSRISVGAVFVRRAYGAMIDSARELLGTGTLATADSAIEYEMLEAMFASR